MNLYEIERAASLALCALLLALVAGYVGWLLPRLTSQAAAGTTAVLAALFCIGAVFLADVVAAWLLACAAALVGAHGGWISGRRSLRAASRLAKARQMAKALPVPPPQTKATRVGLHQGTTPRDSAPLINESTRSTLGRFKIDREIGRGSMGAVYLGLDPAGRQVAIKTLALGREFEGDALAEARSRFLREAETAGRLRHPGIVRFFEAGEDAGLAYIAMEYLRGHDLQVHARPGRLLPVTTVLLTVARVAEALAYAHRQGVVHRDVKPANVMVDPDRNLVKVMDFGIAQVTDSRRTRTGMVLGTPSFMSPEQMAGGRIDGRSDIYSLGVMLFQLLTGRLPHQADSMARVMYLIANEPAPDVRSIRPELPEALANVVALALEKHPETRYADAHQLATDLHEVESWLISAQAAAAHLGSSALVAPAPAASQHGVVATHPQAAGDFTATVALLRPDTRHNRKT